MTILIKGMEMPEAGQEIIIAENWDGTIYACLEPSEGGWCPVVEVPTPHGRLIDADKLYKWIKAECNPYGKPRIGYEDGNKVLDIIKATSTVIEAEEG